MHNTLKNNFQFNVLCIIQRIDIDIIIECTCAIYYYMYV